MKLKLNGCLTAHRQLGHIGPTLGVDAVYCHAQDQFSMKKEVDYWYHLAMQKPFLQKSLKLVHYLIQLIGIIAHTSLQYNI
jgi:hypothetical protein